MLFTKHMWDVKHALGNLTEGADEAMKDRLAKVRKGMSDLYGTNSKAMLGYTETKREVSVDSAVALQVEGSAGASRVLLGDDSTLPSHSDFFGSLEVADDTAACSHCTHIPTHAM